MRYAMLTLALATLSPPAAPTPADAAPSDPPDPAFPPGREMVLAPLVVSSRGDAEDAATLALADRRPPPILVIGRIAEGAGAQIATRDAPNAGKVPVPARQARPTAAIRPAVRAPGAAEIAVVARRLPRQLRIACGKCGACVGVPCDARTLGRREYHLAREEAALALP